MTALTNYIANKDDLLPPAISMTVLTLLLIYVLSHWLSYGFGLEIPERPQESMEVRELIKLEIKPVRRVERFVKHAAKTMARPQPSKARGAAPDPGSIPRTDITALVQGFDMQRLVAKESPATRSPVRNPNRRVVTLNNDVTVQEAGLAPTGLLAAAFDIRPSTQLARRGGGGTPSQGPRVQIGAGRGEGRGSGSSGGLGLGNGVGGGLNGIPGSKGMGQRNTRGLGDGKSDGPRISMGGFGNGTGGEEGISIHELIEWMKKHPGLIPKLVAYEMGHQAGDLSSAISFTMQGRSFTLYLSCNEHELLLRICLVEGVDYTMLKDNGIKENSNFLVMGDVIRHNGQIQSLISSRQAPRDVAAAFYSIFWSWWQSVNK